MNAVLKIPTVFPLLAGGSRRVSWLCRSLVLIFFPGADGLDEGGLGQCIHIDKAVGADIVLLTGVFVYHQTLETVRVQRGLLPAVIGIHAGFVFLLDYHKRCNINKC